MHGIIARLRRLGRASIWGAGSVSLEDARVERLLRRSLPEFYIACWAFGSLGVLGGVPALRQTFGEDFAVVLAFAIAAASLVCFVAEAFPARLWRVELYAVSMLGLLIIVYAATVTLAGFTTGDLGRSAVGAAIYAMSALPRWRRGDVARESRVHGW
jgi:hypothetical protein